MKELFKIVLLFSVPLFLSAQTTYQYNAALYVEGAQYTNRTVDSTGFDPGPPGAGNWDLSAYTNGSEVPFEMIAYDPSIPHIGECDVIPNLIPYFYSVTESTETEGWGFYYYTSSYVDPLGLYGYHITDATYELWGFNDSYSHAYTWPVNIGDSWVEYSAGGGTGRAGLISVDYVYQDTMWHRVDGYGQVVLPIGTFDALRIIRRHWRHNFSDDWLFGFDRTLRDWSYAWVVTELGIAVTFTSPSDTTGSYPDSTFTVGKLTFQISNSAVGIREQLLPDEIETKIFPNPFNAACTIQLTGLQPFGTLDIFDVNGIMVDKLIVNPGVQEVIWAPSNLGSGVYFLRNTRNNSYLVAKIIYVK
ncbi:T9SS type A sorting domain-containing protein [bacterium]|nr:T9SS type A sorting domain-containing protein [bacterium]